MVLCSLALLPLLLPVVPQCIGGGDQPQDPVFPGPEPETFQPGGPEGPRPRTGGPTSPGPSSPGSPGPDSPGPVGPASPGGGPAGPMGGTLPRSPGAQSTNFDDDWLTWWRWNKEAFVEHAFSAGPVTGDGSVVTSGLRADLIESLITPALVNELEDGRGREVHSAALLALGQALGSDDDLALLTEQLQDSSRWVRDNATLALGLTGRQDAARILSQLATGDRAAADLCGGQRMSDRGRSFALCSLALVGTQTENADVRRFVVSELARRVTREKGEPVTSLSAVLGLAVLAESELGLANDAPDLFLRASEWLVSRELDVRVRAHVPRLIAALAAESTPEIGDDAVVALLDALKAKPRAEIRSGIVQALGHLAIARESLANDAVKALVASAKDGDPFERRMAYLALGRRAAKVGGDDAVKFLTRAAKRSTGWTEPWVALALGLWGWEEDRAGVTPHSDRLRAMRVAYKRSGNPDSRAAWALALGLSHDAEAGRSLEAAVIKSPPQYRGIYALALGLTGSTESLEVLRSLDEDVEHNPALFEDVVIARSLLGDTELSKSLLEGFEKACCMHSAGAHARALGRVGDARLVGPLVSVLESKERRGIERAWSASALGRLAMGTPAPWTSRFSIGLNYRAVVGSLTSTDGSGLLDLN